MRPLIVYLTAEEYTLTKHSYKEEERADYFSQKPFPKVKLIKLMKQVRLIPMDYQDKSSKEVEMN